MYPQLLSFVDSSKTICDSLGFGVRPGLGLIEIDMQYVRDTSRMSIYNMSYPSYLLGIC